MDHVSTEPAGVSVTASARATATPDIARLTIGVSETHLTVADAVDALARHSAALTEALHNRGVAGPDLVTTGLSVHPQSQWVDGGRQENTGFTASTTFRVVLRDLAPGAAHSPAAVITACVAAGGDAIRLDSLEFDLEDRTELAVRARESAWTAALSKARQFADLAQKNLVDVLEITEGVDQMSPVRGLVSAARAVSAPIAIEHGEIEETISVRVRWSLE